MQMALAFIAARSRSFPRPSQQLLFAAEPVLTRSKPVKQNAGASGNPSPASSPKSDESTSTNAFGVAAGL